MGGVETLQHGKPQLTATGLGRRTAGPPQRPLRQSPQQQVGSGENLGAGPLPPLCVGAALRPLPVGWKPGSATAAQWVDSSQRSGTRRPAASKADVRWVQPGRWCGHWPWTQWLEMAVPGYGISVLCPLSMCLKATSPPWAPEGACTPHALLARHPDIPARGFNNGGLTATRASESGRPQWVWPDTHARIPKDQKGPGQRGEVRRAEGGW